MSDGNAPLITALAENILEKINIINNPYFVSLRDGSMSLDEFRKSQQQFYFAVHFFSRPMAVLIARIPEPKDRLDILHNLLEEHGDMEEGHFHISSFKKFLASIGSEPTQLKNIDIAPAVKAFNSVLISCCSFDNVVVGICCMGIIERAFAGISAAISRAIIDRKWTNKQGLCHYSLHAELDIAHADEFFKIAEPKFIEEQHHIQQGLELGGYIFDRLYRDMCYA